MYVIALCNQKGGVGKTTVAHQLICGLARRGYRVLGIDTDPQCNLTYACTDIPISNLTMGGVQQKSVVNLFRKAGKVEDNILHVEEGNFDFIPSSSELAVIDVELSQVTGREYRLSEAIAPLKKQYDFIVIDTPPNVGQISTNALTASTHVIIPAIPDAFSVTAFANLLRFIDPVRAYTNKDLKVAGVLFVAVKRNTISYRNVRDQAVAMLSPLGVPVFESFIRETNAVKEAQLLRVDLFSYKKWSTAAIDFENFTDELLSKLT